jgi:hypothetical protein
MARESRRGLPNRRSVFRILAPVAMLALSTSVQSGETSTNATTHSSEARPVVYIGEVNVRSAMRFLDLIASYENRNVSLDVLVKPSAPGEYEKFRYLADCHDDQVGVSMTGKDGIGLEVVRNGSCKSVGGRFPIKGEFFVLSGGFTQGVSSLGLMPPRRGRAHPVDRKAKPRVRF